jgi:hypothetical protein
LRNCADRVNFLHRASTWGASLVQNLIAVAVIWPRDETEKKCSCQLAILSSRVADAARTRALTKNIFTHRCMHAAVEITVARHGGRGSRKEK